MSEYTQVTDNFPLNLIDSVTASNKPLWKSDTNETRPSLLSVLSGNTRVSLSVYMLGGNKYLFLGSNTLLGRK